MALFEVVVEEVDSTNEAAKLDAQTAGVPLSTLLGLTGGEYVWHYTPADQLRKHWRKTGRVIGDSNLQDVARAETIPISLEHLRGKDPATTRVKIRFEISYSSPAESKAAEALDGPQLL